MGATLRPIDVKCTCGERATHEVAGPLGQRMGLWCKKCGTQYAKELDAKAQAPKKGKRDND